MQLEIKPAFSLDTACEFVSPIRPCATVRMLGYKTTEAYSAALSPTYISGRPSSHVLQLSSISDTAC